MASPIDKLLGLCRDVLAPLVRADGGELYLVALEPEQITLHLAGTCAGCPGAVMTTKAVIEPAVQAVAPSTRVIVTAGIHIPEGASLVS